MRSVLAALGVLGLTALAWWWLRVPGTTVGAVPGREHAPIAQREDGTPAPAVVRHPSDLQPLPPPPQAPARPLQEARMGPPDGLLSGLVVDAQGAPVPGARVGLYSLEEVLAGAVIERTVTDRQGRFGLRNALSDGDMILSVRHKQRGSAWLEEVLGVPGERVDLGTIVLDAPTVLGGRVTDVDGRPLAGVRVRYHAGVMETFCLYIRHVELECPRVAGDGFGREVRLPVQAETRTDSEGRYALTLPLSAEPTMLSAELTGYAPGLEECKDVEAGTLDFVLEPAAFIAGRVVNEGGDLPGDTWVITKDEDHAVLGPQPVRGDGVFRLDGLTPGEHTIMVLAPGYPPATASDVATGTDDLVVNLPRLGTLTVRVTTGDGSLPGAFTLLLREKPGGGWFSLDFGSHLLPWTRNEFGPADEGYAVVENLASGTYYVMAQRPNGGQSARLKERVRAGEISRRGPLAVGDPLPLRGSVAQRGTGAPLVAAEVGVFEPGEEFHLPGSPTWTDEEGHFFLPRVPPGRVKIVVRAPFHRDEERKFVHPDGPPLMLRLKPTAALQLILSPGFRARHRDPLELRVRPVSSARRADLRRAQSAGAGFLLDGLEPGLWALRLMERPAGSSDWKFVARLEADLPAGRLTRLEF